MPLVKPPRAGISLGDMWPLTFSTDDLAPGDARSADLDLSAFQFDRICTVDDPLFEMAFRELWREFGAKNEMERRETLAQRFGRAPEILYELILVRRDGEFVAVRDHTAIFSSTVGAVVHLSHNLVSLSARRSGLSGWLRAFPIQTARECLSLHQTHSDSEITLVGEMEYDDGSDPACSIRLKAYENAGFQKVDPAMVRYFQPDFRAFEEIDASGSACPLPFQLIVRRVGRENEMSISGKEVRGLVKAIYTIYGPQFREQDLAHPDLSLDRYPADETQVPLVKPTRG